jgi:hypothetical protein
VLTKTDKALEKEINAVKKAVRGILAASPLGVETGPAESPDATRGNQPSVVARRYAPSSIRIVTTSSVSREGRDSIWEVLGREIYQAS